MERDEGLYLLLLKDAADAVASAGSLDAALAATVDLVAERLGFDVCSIYLADESGDLVLRATHGLRRESIGKVRMKTTEGLTGLVAETERSFFTSRADEHPRFKFFPETGEELFRSFGGVPLMQRGRCTGVLTVQTIREYAFPANEIVVLQTLAGQIISLIELTRRLGRTKHSVVAEPAREPGARGLLAGLGTSPGIGLGRVVSLGVDPSLAPPPSRPFAGETAERERFEGARAEAARALDALALQFGTREQGSPAEKILRAHQELLLDPGLADRVGQRIRDHSETAEQAVHQAIEEFASLLRGRAGAPELADKVHDFYDVRGHLLRALGVEASRRFAVPDASEGIVVLAEFLTPAETAHLDPARVTAIVTEHGSETSHASILARSLGIPAVVAIPELRAKVASGERLLVDGDNGFVFHEPDGATIAEYAKRRESARAAELRVADELARRRAKGPLVPGVQLLANVGLPSELGLSRELGADGIGLLRTELFFLQQSSWPTRREQVAFYRRAFRAAPARGPIVVRLLDAGGDKELPYVQARPEPNPILGLRSVRFLLAQAAHCRDQLAALLEAADLETADVRILVPLVTTAWELTAVREMLLEVSAKEGFTARKLGMMVEAPSVLYQLDDLLPLADFVSIGTNDLTQYLLAVDRDNELVRHYYSPYHPAVVRSLAALEQALARRGLAGSICGEMAGEALGALALLALGYRSLSVRPRAVRALRCLVHCVGEDLLDDVRAQLVAAPTSDEVERILRRALREQAPFLLEAS